jgi:hypothetical protein
MRRPTCATCPHWHGSAAGNALCRLLLLVSLAHDSCGEHPDMPAWIAKEKADA